MQADLVAVLQACSDRCLYTGAKWCDSLPHAQLLIICMCISLGPCWHDQDGWSPRQQCYLSVDLGISPAAAHPPTRTSDLLTGMGSPPTGSDPIPAPAEADDATARSEYFIYTVRHGQGVVS